MLQDESRGTLGVRKSALVVWAEGEYMLLAIQSRPAILLSLCQNAIESPFENVVRGFSLVRTTLKGRTTKIWG